MPHKARDSTAKVRGQLKGAGLKAKKSLGQNFLVNEDIRDSIVEAAALSAGDTVIEVGPGLGILTEKLAAHAGKVVAVELDDGLAGRLRNRLSRFSNIDIINADILSLGITALSKGAKYKVVANIPYYITSPVLRYFMQAGLRPSLMVIMMQEEVARDVTAKPGAMGFLAVSMRLFSIPKIVLRVPADCFYPAPKVDSAVVRFDMLERPAVEVGNVEGFLELVHAGFGAPRKQLHNSLAIGLRLEPAAAEEILVRAGIDSRRRPGTLTLDEWSALYRQAGSAPC
ncbi:MAG: 16S rRNA (adenine(1518)-N(6)/adenine(1519)-N(6))-dimethyltransferase RsmA [Chloroflexi bacterium]|nr:16S rRNA (adenine(1518)-N(6)/adenine(1519)-N(6))-dimethyltransferase RsmA [Chloroflexota bacterium]